MWESIVNFLGSIGGVSRWRTGTQATGLAFGVGFSEASVGVVFALLGQLAWFLWFLLKNAEVIQETKILEKQTVKRALALKTEYGLAADVKVPRLTQFDPNGEEASFSESHSIFGVNAAKIFGRRLGETLSATMSIGGTSIAIVLSMALLKRRIHFFEKKIR